MDELKHLPANKTLNYINKGMKNSLQQGKNETKLK